MELLPRSLESTCTSYSIFRRFVSALPKGCGIDSGQVFDKFRATDHIKSDMKTQIKVFTGLPILLSLAFGFSTTISAETSSIEKAKEEGKWWLISR